MIILDHLRKPSNFEGKVPKKEHLFSSQDKVASVEILLMLKSQDDGETIYFYQRKNRIGREIDPFKMTMKDTEREGGGVVTEFRYEGLIEEAEAKKEQAKELILECLEEEGRTRKELLNIVYQKAKIGNRNSSDALRDLERDGLIDKSKQGRNNFYQLIKKEENDVIKENSNLF